MTARASHARAARSAVETLAQAAPAENGAAATAARYGGTGRQRDRHRH